MKREIKFRGKSKTTNTLLYGDLLRNELDAFAVVPPFKLSMDNECNLYEVDENTIGQFTGKKDKNGKEIYEGDILIHIYMGSVFKVEYSERNAAFMLIHPTNESYNMGIYDIENCFKVIGNIYDNPELLEE